MEQHSKSPVITKRLIVICSTLLIIFAAIAYIGFKIAQRDAAFAVDFGFKWFGASTAIFFALFGPFGLIGFALMRGKLAEGPGIIYRLMFALVISLAITAWVLYRFNAYSLFF